MTTATRLSPLDTGLETINRSRSWLQMLLEDIPGDKLLHRPQPKANHAAWIMGHLCYADETFRTTLDENESRVVPESYDALFGMNTDPMDDASKYPSRAELLSAMQASREAFLKWIQSLNEEQLSKPLPENLQSFASCPLTLVHTLAIHESTHAGQIIEIRRSLGLPRKMG